MLYQVVRNTLSGAVLLFKSLKSHQPNHVENQLFGFCFDKYILNLLLFFYFFTLSLFLSNDTEALCVNSEMNFK